MSSEHAHTPTIDMNELLALLLVPDPDDLSDEQRRGAVCVWGDRPLTHLSAVDLGEQQADDGTNWYPRACRPHVQRHAMEALQTHSGSCEQCADDHTRCPSGLGLVRLIKETRR
ncbi:hypothetical protein [Streptomyces prunicolor]